MTNTLMDPGIAAVTADQEHQAGVSGHISAKAATMVTARALLADPTTSTEHLAGVSTFDEQRDIALHETYVENKPERYAIAAVIVDKAADELVTNPSDSRDARFINLPDIPTEQEVFMPTKQGVSLRHYGGRLDKLKTDLAAAVVPVAASFLDKNPELARAVQRFEQISEGIDKPGLDADLTTAERVILNAADSINNLVIDEYIPLMQRLLVEAGDNTELATEEQRREVVKDGAQQIIFSSAALNLGHLEQIGGSQGAWGNFALKDGLEASLIKSKDGKWTVKLAPGFERPAKPKDDLAGDTISCPALLQLEATDGGSPLHRLIYATINEAYERGVFSDPRLRQNMLRHNNEKVEAERRVHETRARTESYHRTMEGSGFDLTHADATRAYNPKG